MIVRDAMWRPSDFIKNALDDQFPMHPVIKKRAEPVDENADVVQVCTRERIL